MKILFLTSLAFTAIAAASSADTVTFDNFKTRATPPGWTATQTGSGSAKWSVEKDDSAPSKPNVLKQSGQATFPVCIKNDTNLKDGFVEVKFKPVSGREDQAGGVIWRAKDSNNYYIARANALEGNVVLYKTVNGKRSSLDIVGRKGGYGVKEPVGSGQWHTLRVEFAGKHFKGHPVLLNFFASWCPPCREEISSLTHLYKQYSKEGVTIVGIAVDSLLTPESVGDVKPLAEKLAIPYPVAIATDKIAKDYHFKGIPTIAVIDKDG